MKKLYLISQVENIGYDTYDCAVVCALSEKSAKEMDPQGVDGSKMNFGKSFSYWCSSKEHVTAVFLGVAEDKIPIGVVSASFNAG